MSISDMKQVIKKSGKLSGAFGTAWVLSFCSDSDIYCVAVMKQCPPQKLFFPLTLSTLYPFDYLIYELYEQLTGYVFMNPVNNTCVNVFLFLIFEKSSTWTKVAIYHKAQGKHKEINCCSIQIN